MSQSACPNVHFYWRLKRNVLVHDSERHATLLANLRNFFHYENAPRHQDKTNHRSGNTGRRSSSINNISSNSLSPNKYSRKRSSPPQSRYLLTVMAIWQPLQHPPQSFSAPWSMTSIDDAPLCRFCLARNKPIAHCPDIVTQLHATTINKGEDNLTNMAIHPDGATLVLTEDGCHRNTVQH